jgi:hypothetical protein
VHKRRLKAAVVAVAMIAGMLTLGSGSASATWPGWVQFVNHATTSIKVGKHWCDELDNPFQNDYPCTHGEQSMVIRAAGPDRTPSGEDWDGFLVPAGCDVYWDVEVFLGAEFSNVFVDQTPIYRRNSSVGYWKKVTDNLLHKVAHIRSVQCEPTDDQHPTDPEPEDPPGEGGGSDDGSGGGGGSSPPPPPPTSIEVKRNDYNNDGFSDLVGVRAATGCLARWKGNGNGSVTSLTDYGCGWDKYNEVTAVGDITGDGIGDLVAIRKADGCLARWKGTSGFGFIGLADYGCGWGNYTELTGAGDITSDGIGDLVAIRKADGCLARWKGTSGGGFTYIQDAGCGWDKYTELTGVGDITGDGIGDLVAIGKTSGCITRWIGRGNGGLTYVGTYGCGWLNYTNLVGMGDLTGDGVGDVVGRRVSDGCLARWTGTTRAGLNYMGDAGCGWGSYVIS